MNYKLPSKFPLLPRKKNTDKSFYGHTLIVAGSRGMVGAALLSSRAALESGSGLVTLAIPNKLILSIPKSVPEVMSLPLPQTKEGSVAFSAYLGVSQFIFKRKASVLLVGPGLAQNSETVKFIKKVVLTSHIPVVLDADGLNSFKGKPRELLCHKAPLVLTPHRREFERLFLVSWPESQTQRIELAKKLSKFYDVVLVMKGHRTLVAYAGKCYLNTTGNPGMAKGGSGDVLSGIIAAFIAQGLEPFLAACWAVYFHGMAGDMAVKERGELGLLASDIIRFLPKAFLKR